MNLFNDKLLILVYMDFDNLPIELKREIYYYDSTYRDKYTLVVDEFNLLLKKYDLTFYKYHMINNNMWGKDINIKNWIKKYGIIYEPIRWILNLSN